MNKIIVIGNGDVGSSYSFALMAQGVGSDVGIIDLDANKVAGDVQDLTHGLAYVGPKNIYSATYADCSDADMIVITAGAAQKENETRLDLVKRNAAIMKSIVEAVIREGFNGIFLIASNPVDVLTHYVKELTGFPPKKVIGSGTSLDSARLRSAVGEKFQIDPRDVNIYILGEHGDTQFPVWSHGNIGGLKITEWLDQHPEFSQEDLLKLSENVKNAAYEIINYKGSTHYGIAIALARITQAILQDENSVLPVSVHLEGQYNSEDVCIGSNAVINREGIREIIETPLDEDEKKSMQHSIQTLKNMQDSILEDPALR
ncbi:L-lactate dehydrogenase [Enterococcus sp. BWB1-3]|uniref:L-lactate dehydrogenase n=1 Tax=unclassified Enterococcus TaxID=2608891 RepID=UPI0019213DA6|nr:MULTISPECIES: L-lactate dehydrogenase [unclassified Enterococcus]MBL1230179.1 L-lactate dehydrogenase [Enterococcus sp. BWB1-3]MCB5953179.1 L-lactate dehydrogenase [Enterococcus sp. BWT-B8]MCB5953778.1 L-lactate dehydrogenase [Enterococcus sp. CWB-B31]